MRAEAADRLTAVVAAYPWSRGCALARLADHEKIPADISMSDVGMRFGFSRIESHGIMDGWDTRSGRFGCWTSDPEASTDEYRDGFKLGAELAARFNRVGIPNDLAHPAMEGAQ